MVETRGNRLLVVANAHSGRKDTQAILGRVERAARRRRFQIDRKLTQTPNEATEVIQNSIGEYDGLGIVGGDGSLRNAIEALLTSGENPENFPILFLVRAGSTNVLEKAAGNHISASGVIRTLREGKCYELDVVRATIDGGPENGGSEMYFVSNASIGLSGKLFNLKDRMNNQRGGFWGYVPEIPKVFNDAKDYAVEVTIDDKEPKKLSHLSEMVILNAGKAGIVPFGPKETYDGKNLLVISFNGPYTEGETAAANALATLGGAIYDMVRPGEKSDFEERHSAKRIKVVLIDDQGIPLQLDGDGVGVVNKSIEFTIFENAVKIMAQDQDHPKFTRRIIGKKSKAFSGQGRRVIWVSSTPSTER